MPRAVAAPAAWLTLALAFGWVFAHAALAHALEVPALRAHVNDYAHVLPADRAASLETRLGDFENRSGHQFALLTIPSLSGDPIEDFSIRVAERWKLGNKGKDDGLIVVIAPAEHKMRIEVGYGLEGDIPDAIASRVIRDVLAPAFRSGDYAGGVDAAFDTLMRATGDAGGTSRPPSSTAVRRAAPPQSLFGPLLMPLLIFIVLSLLSRRGRRRGGFFVGPMMGGGFGGGWGGGGGGGGGGGWGGGRGGGFGGGGASGGW